MLVFEVWQWVCGFVCTFYVKEIKRKSVLYGSERSRDFLIFRVLNFVYDKCNSFYCFRKWRETERFLNRTWYRERCPGFIDRGARVRSWLHCVILEKSVSLSLSILSNQGSQQMNSIIPSNSRIDVF